MIEIKNNRLHILPFKVKNYDINFDAKYVIFEKVIELDNFDLLEINENLIEELIFRSIYGNIELIINITKISPLSLLVSLETDAIEEWGIENVRNYIFNFINNEWQSPLIIDSRNGQMQGLDDFKIIN